MASLSHTDELLEVQHAPTQTPVLLYTKTSIAVLALASAAIQVVWFQPGDLYVFLALLGTAMTFYAFRSSILLATPISGLSLIGCGASNFFLPLFLTTLEAKPLTFELQRPDLTFGFNLVAFATLIVCHFVYARSSYLQSARGGLSTRILAPIGIFRAPTPNQLMAIGAVGLGSMFAVSLVFGTRPEENFGNPFLKLLEALSFLAYAPYLMALYPLIGHAPMRWRSAVWPIALFSAALLIAGSARNSRTALVLGFVGLAIGFLLGAWVGVFPSRVLRLRNIVVVGLVIAMLFPIAERLASAMVVVRTENFHARPIEALVNTIDVFLSEDAALAFQEMDETSTTSAKWHGGDEYYLDNLFFARLCNLKFADNTLAIVWNLDQAGRQDIASREVAMALSILPQPILSGLGVELDKQTSRGSMGSFIYSIVLGSEQVAGYFATGSYLASAWACFGIWFPLGIGLIAIPLFLVIDSFATTAWPTQRMIIAPVALLSLYPTTVLFTSAGLAPDSLSGLIETLLRELPQQAILYCAVFWLLRQIVPR